MLRGVAEVLRERDKEDGGGKEEGGGRRETKWEDRQGQGEGENLHGGC